MPAAAALADSVSASQPSVHAGHARRKETPGADFREFLAAPPSRPSRASNQSMPALVPVRPTDPIPVPVGGFIKPGAELATELAVFMEQNCPVIGKGMQAAREIIWGMAAEAHFSLAWDAPGPPAEALFYDYAWAAHGSLQTPGHFATITQANISYAYSASFAGAHGLDANGAASWSFAANYSLEVTIVCNTPVYSRDTGLWSERTVWDEEQGHWRVQPAYTVQQKITLRYDMEGNLVEQVAGEAEEIRHPGGAAGRGGAGRGGMGHQEGLRFGSRGGPGDFDGFGDPHRFIFGKNELDRFLWEAIGGRESAGRNQKRL